MTEQEVIELMLESKSEKEWNANCDKVKSTLNGQYPSFWYKSIILSAVHARAKQRYNW